MNGTHFPRKRTPIGRHLSCSHSAVFLPYSDHADESWALLVGTEALFASLLVNCYFHREMTLFFLMLHTGIPIALISPVANMIIEWPRKRQTSTRIGTSGYQGQASRENHSPRFTQTVITGTVNNTDWRTHMHTEMRKPSVLYIQPPRTGHNAKQNQWRHSSWSLRLG